MKHIGIIGGGQLGVMLGESINKFGSTAHALGPIGSPASKFLAEFKAGDLNSKTDITEFAKGKDAIVLEVEHVDPSLLQTLQCSIFPRLDTLEICRHRRLEKEFLRDQGLPHADWEFIDSVESAANTRFEFPCVSKTTVGGYDGLGQGIQGTKSRLKGAVESASEQELRNGFVLEELIDLYTEVSCIVVTDAHGHQAAFPVIENFHRNHVLDLSVLPAEIPKELEELVMETAKETARLLGSPGLITVEFFVTQTKPRGPYRSAGGFYLLINEIAPRPHNSGHLTRCATSISQFDALARILLDIPLVEPTLTDASGAWAMGNLLSDLWLPSKTLNTDALRAFPNIYEFFLYGKDPSRPKRKMGHVVTHEKSAESARQTMDDLRAHLSSSAR